MRPDVCLQPFGVRDPWADLVRLRRWLGRKHVARWFVEPDDHLDWASDPPPGGDHAWIAGNGAVLGYLRWQRVDRATLDGVGLTEIPAGAVDIDLFIGEEGVRGRGIGPAALGCLLDRLRAEGDVPLAGLTTSVRNRPARRAFEKAGFTLAREYEPPGLGPCWLLVQRLDSGA